MLEATEKTQYPIIKSVWNGVKKNIFDLGKHADIAEYLLHELKKTITVILNSNSNTSNKLSVIMSIKDDFSYMDDIYYESLRNIFNIFDGYSINNTRFIRTRSCDIYEDYTQSIVAEINNYKWR